MSIGYLHRVRLLASMEKSSGRGFELTVLQNSLWELSASEFEVNDDGDDGANANIVP